MYEKGLEYGRTFRLSPPTKLSAVQPLKLYISLICISQYLWWGSESASWSYLKIRDMAYKSSLHKLRGIALPYRGPNAQGRTLGLPYHWAEVRWDLAIGLLRTYHQIHEASEYLYSADTFIIKSRLSGVMEDMLLEDIAPRYLPLLQKVKLKYARLQRTHNQDHFRMH
jgi:hypothetical protein